MVVTLDPPRQTSALTTRCGGPNIPRRLLMSWIMLPESEKKMRRAASGASPMASRMACSRLAGRALDHLLRDIVEGIQREFTQVAVVAAVEVVGLDEADIRHGEDLFPRELVSRIVAASCTLPSASCPKPRRPRRSGPLPRTEKHMGFSMNTCFPAFSAATATSVFGSAKQSNTASRSRERRVLETRDAGARRHMVHFADEVDQLRGRVAEPGQLVPFPEFGDMGQMLDLGDRAAADHADPDAVHRRSFPAVDALGAASWWRRPGGVAWDRCLGSMPSYRCDRWGCR